jgi:AGCS family alanine or glycine:cation symporter
LGWDKANLIAHLGGVDLEISWVGLALVVMLHWQFWWY